MNNKSQKIWRCDTLCGYYTAAAIISISRALPSPIPDTSFEPYKLQSFLYKVYEHKKSPRC
jgi:hypothetical protein